MSDLEFRSVPESDVDRVLDLADMVFHERTEEDKRERLRWLPRRAERIGAYEDGELVGFVGALPERMSVPGGALDCAGVTFVGVLPTHRRRGVLTTLMDRLWASTRAPLAALYASEAAIYGRFGYGLATRALTMKVDSSRPLDLRIEPDPRTPRLVPRERAGEALADLYARACARRPGRLLRDPEWWPNMVLPDTSEDDDDLTPPRVVMIDGDPGGYAIYRARGEDETRGLPGTVHLEELEGDTPAVEAALWRYLASIDLTRQIAAWNRPVDDPLPLLAADPDQVRITGDQGMIWLRLIDVPTALAARGWAADADLVLEIADDRIPANQGRWRLRTATATCEPTDAAADLSLTARDLAAVYLGGTPLVRLARAGLIAEHTPDAATHLDAALQVPQAPHTPDDF